MKKLTIEEVEQRVKEVAPSLSLVKESYTTTHNVCTWIHCKYGSFERKPVSIYLLKDIKHPKEKKDELYSFWKDTISKYWTINVEFKDQSNESIINVQCLVCNTMQEKRIKKLIEACSNSRSGCHICWKKYVKTQEYAKTMGERSAEAGSESRQEQSTNLSKTIMSLTKEERRKIYGHFKGKKQKEEIVEKRRKNYREKSIYKGLSQACAQTGAPRGALIEMINNGELTIDDAIAQALAFNRNEAGTDIEKMMSKTLNIPRFDKSEPKIKENQGLIRKPDFKISDKLYVDIHGLISHSSKYGKLVEHHFIRRTEFEKEGLRLLQFYSDEVYNKKELIKSIINSNNNIFKKTINSVKCLIKPIDYDIADNFFKTNYLSNVDLSNATTVGLHYKNKLVASFAYTKQQDLITIKAFACKKNIKIQGHLKKIIEYIDPLTVCDIFCETDLRFEFYDLSRSGFVSVYDSQGWFWTNGRKRIDNITFKDKIAINDQNSEEYAKSLGFYKIGDAGKRLWKRPKLIEADSPTDVKND